MAVFFRNSLNVKQVNLCSSQFNFFHFLQNFEFLCIEYVCNNNTVRLICIYVPPKYSICTDTIKAVCSVIDISSSPEQPCYVIGDFNLPKIDWNIPSSYGGQAHDYFVNFCVTRNWHQQILAPTHIKSNILDLVLCNYAGKNLLVSTAVNAPLTFSCDHNLISLSLNTNPITSIPNFQQYPNFKQANFNDICQKLNCIDWTPSPCWSLQDYYNNFISTITSIINIHVPKHTTQKKKYKIPKHIKSLLADKQKLYKKYKVDKSLKHNYKAICNEYEVAVRNWVDDTENKVCQNPSSKKFYSHINKKLKSKNSIPLLVDPGSNCPIYSDLDKASVFN